MRGAPAKRPSPPAPLPAPLPHRRRRGAALAGVLFAALFPTFATWLYFVVLADRPRAAAVFAACKVVQFAFPLAWALGVERSRYRLNIDLDLAPRGLGLGLLSGLVAVAAALVAWRPLLAAVPAGAGVPAAVDARLSSLGIESVAGFLLLAGFYSLFHSGLEEYYWRWFVFGRLRGPLSATAAALLSSLAFTAHHVLVVGTFLGSFGPATWLFSLAVTAAGLLWAGLYQRSGSLAGPWLSHALADAGLMWIGYRMWTGG